MRVCSRANKRGKLSLSFSIHFEQFINDESYTLVPRSTMIILLRRRIKEKLVKKRKKVHCSIMTIEISNDQYRFMFVLFLLLYFDWNYILYSKTWMGHLSNLSFILWATINIHFVRMQIFFVFFVNHFISLNNE